jgi:diguanylate cyclase (GGDEF)-like protein
MLAGTIRLRAAQNQNPLTHLPANDAIIGHIGRGTENRNRDHAFAYLDFNNFKPFNDVYGFHVGDRAIIMFAELLRAEFGRDDAFVGHIGGDDFFVGLSGEVGEFAQRLRDVCARFSANAESLYSAQPPSERLHRMRRARRRRHAVSAALVLDRCAHAPGRGAAGFNGRSRREAVRAQNGGQKKSRLLQFRNDAAPGSR